MSEEPLSQELGEYRRPTAGCVSGQSGAAAAGTAMLDYDMPADGENTSFFLLGY